MTIKSTIQNHDSSNPVSLPNIDGTILVLAVIVSGHLTFQVNENILNLRYPNFNVSKFATSFSSQLAEFGINPSGISNSLGNMAVVFEVEGSAPGVFSLASSFNSELFSIDEQDFLANFIITHFNKKDNYDK